MRFPLGARPVMAAIMLSCLARGQAPLRGIVRDANGGEPLARVKLLLQCGPASREKQSGAGGRFEIQPAADAACTLAATLVGYRPLRIEVEPGRELELALTPDNLARKDSIDVAAGPFELSQAASSSERTLTGAELKNLAGVVSDDPLRAVQALPGVASSNDFVAQFSVRGASFDRVGIFLDGVLLHSPFHTVQSQEETGSLSILNSDLIEELTLHLGAVPVPYQDRTGAALDLLVREGSRRAPSVRFNAGAASAGFMAEGPLGRTQRGSWLAAVRRSYLQYLLRKTSAGDSLAFGFSDAQARFSYDLNRRNNVTLGVLDGRSDLDRTHVRDKLGINSIMNGDYRVTAANLGWRYSPSSALMITNHGAWMRERSGNINLRDLPLGGEGYAEWVWNASAVWSWRSNAPLQAGSSMRRIHDDGFSSRYNFNPLALRQRDEWRGTALRAGGFLEQGWTRGPISLTAGARFDGYSLAGPAAVSPHLSAMLRVAPKTRLQAAWSQSVQYPAIMPLTIQRTGNAGLLPLRANHFVAAVEQQLGERTRLRAEVFSRADRDLIAQPLLEPRYLANGQIFNPPASPRFVNSVRGTARGMELFLQRRTANRLSGWVSYGYTRTAMTDGVTGARYVADYEQRHTVNVYASYRLRPSVNMSARYTYGSNFPVPGFLKQTGPLAYALSTERNGLRLPAYHRSDVRLNKSFQKQSWRGVLYVEVMNLTNHVNTTYDSFGGYNSRTGQAYPSFLKLFPIVPAAGLMLEWDASARRK
ncbi:MAG: TonB-dependent receptor plug domain-containing protein [Candidatus Solibacter usitatus]|nr:TonB-dependent receptor plug domain-containing protein [Candidatus Solibacter usitatus]